MFSFICLILSIILFIIYNIIIYIKYKPSCISESYYFIKCKLLFTFWIILVSFLIFPSWVDISPINFQFLPFLSVISLMSVGIYPKYLESEKTVHIFSALVSVIISLIWNIITTTYVIPLLFLVLLIILYIIKTKNLLFWIECSAFLSIYLSILLF